MYTKQGLKEEDIKRIAEIEQILFLPHKAAEYDKCLSFLKAEKNCYIGLFNDQDLLIGYMNCVPLKKEVYDGYKNSTVDEEDVCGDSVVPFHKGDNYCLIETIAVIPEYHKSQGVKLLVNAFMEFVNSLKQQGIVIKEVFGDCVSDAGINFMKRTFNAAFYKKSEWGNIYCGTIQY